MIHRAQWADKGDSIVDFGLWTLRQAQDENAELGKASLKEEQDGSVRLSRCVYEV